MSSTQNSGSSSRQSAVVARKERAERLIRDHIPHFAGLSSKKKNDKGKSKEITIGEEPSGEFFDSNGRIPENAIIESEMSTKDKAYREIQESRGYNTCAAYCGKQVEFLMFCEDFYSDRPLMVRYQATGDKLLSFLYKKVYISDKYTAVLFI